MIVQPEKRQVINELFRIRQLGPAGEEAIAGLFDANAIFIEPFLGVSRTHEGLDRIRDAFREILRAEEGAALTVDQVNADPFRLRAAWTCISPEFPTPMRGVDWFLIRNGKIAELEITVTEMPEFDDAQPPA